MNLYVAGPMSGYPAHNFPAFAAAADRLRAAGHDVVSPHEVPLPCGCCGGPALCAADEHTWAEYLRADLVALLGVAEGVAVLPGWQQSRGANLEVHVADSLGLEVLTVDEWLDMATAGLDYP